MANPLSVESLAKCLWKVNNPTLRWPGPLGYGERYCRMARAALHHIIEGLEQSGKLPAKKGTKHVRATARRR